MVTLASVFLRSVFAKMIAMDYDRGLKMLKSKLETSGVADLVI
jgi:hypothetical protein